MVERRRLLQAGMIGAVSVAGAVGLQRFATANQPAPEPSATPSAAPSGTAAQSTKKVSGKKVATLSELPKGSGKKVRQRNGESAYVIHLANDKIVAYSAVCTHQECTVNSVQSKKELDCPCHGARFDATNDAKVIAGPAPRPLKKLKVAVSGTDIHLV